MYRSGFKMEGLEFWDLGLRFRVDGLRLRLYGFGFRVAALRFRNCFVDPDGLFVPLLRDSGFAFRFPFSRFVFRVAYFMIRALVYL